MKLYFLHKRFWERAINVTFTFVMMHNIYRSKFTIIQPLYNLNPYLKTFFGVLYLKYRTTERCGGHIALTTLFQLLQARW